MEFHVQRTKTVRPSARIVIALFLILSIAAAGGNLLAGDVVINEIHYEPEDKTVPEEFIELFNTGAADVDLSGWMFTNGIEYTFPQDTVIAPGGYLVVAEDPQTFTDRFAVEGALGPFVGRFDNDGEQVVLRNAKRELEDEVDYGIGFPWPMASTGAGSSMELIHPGLDNDLGGSWRASGLVDRPFQERIFYLEGEDMNWHYRKATSEPSDPITAWREKDFVEDDTWLVGQTSIGFNDDDDNTVLEDMRRNYSGVYLRHPFTVPAGEELPKSLILSLFVDDGAVVWINGTEVLRSRVDEGPDPLFDDTAWRSGEAEWEDYFLVNPPSFLVKGENILAIHAMNKTINSSDFSIDARIFVPGTEDFEGILAPPTPGAENSVFQENAPPQVRQVNHSIDQPTASVTNAITAKVTDPDGVASVTLAYQIVLPGHYIPAFLPVPVSRLISTQAREPRQENPEFEDPANWTTITMVDDGTAGDEEAGDETYTAIVPRQTSRTLVRYRVSAVDALGASIRGPYADDPSLNFAYFVYDGVPDYAAATSIVGEPTVHSAETLTSVPVYMLITRNEDITNSVARTGNLQIPQGNQARFAFNWEGAMVYDGVAYDHIRYRLRGANGRYQTPSGGINGKRHWRFKFNKGNLLRARDKWGDRFPTRWKVLNTGRMFGNRIDGNWGLNDQVNDIIWRAYGVPSAYGFTFHWRVIDGDEEAANQYDGDFWGIARAFENYDVRFLEAHDLPKGNIYKLVNQTQVGLEQQRYQSPDAVNNGSDHDNIERMLRPNRDEAWLNAHVDYDKWYHYHAIAQAVRHYDYWPAANKNAAWYFYPEYTEENNFLGRMWTLPFDADATWGPTWNQGQDRPYEAIYSGGKRSFQLDYRNHIREVRDLLWQQDQLELVIRQTAAFMEPLQNADIDRWRNSPASAGRQYFSRPGERSLEGKSQDMMRFAFTGGSWPGGSVGAGGRAATLDSLLRPDRARLPETPEVIYTGSPNFPIDGLTFQSSEFSDPQGSETFKALEWRIAEVTVIPEAGTTPLADPVWKVEPVKLELTATWKSAVLTEFSRAVTVPSSVVRPGTTYRVRVRMMDDTDLWSHWSPPVQFTTGPASGVISEVEDLRVTEIMYNPIGGSDFEFIELQNKGGQTLDLSPVRFEDGIEFDFSESTLTSLEPGGIVVVVRDLDAFSERYDTSTIRVAGEYSGRLNNAGERIRLSFGQLDVLDFIYDDAWYPQTDGEGMSLNIVEIQAPAETWSLAANWSASTVRHGTPGQADGGDPAAGGFLRPGDANSDGRVDVSDAVSLLLLLFGGEVRAPPCEGVTVAAGGNVTLLDFDGANGVNVTDAVLLLEYLFRQGAPHVLGASCARIEGCPNACGG